jgi:hypothetical protein
VRRLRLVTRRRHTAVVSTLLGQQRPIQRVWWIKRKLHGVNHREITLACLLQPRPLVGAAQHVCRSVLCPGDGNTETPQTLQRSVKAFLPSRVSRRRMSSALGRKDVSTCIGCGLSV